VSAKSPEPPPNAESDVVVVTPKRRCGRCRKFFDGDPALHPIAIPEWWACPPAGKSWSAIDKRTGSLDQAVGRARVESPMQRCRDASGSTTRVVRLHL
jgi:hypothetical protein